jgi:wyosine [tRNA(Phe)-imidazoG37] synthetase (radical SAM superfamily)
MVLTVTDHRRDRLGLNYIYPVISRRADGLSIGINLNTNNACNWRCIYCQVPGLRRGKAPDVNLQLLAHELNCVLTDILEGDFSSRFKLPAASDSIRDIAISGNGEPTNSGVFEQVVNLIGSKAGEFGLLNKIKIVLITNGSQIYRQAVINGIKCLSQINGEIWFKLDSATTAGLRSVNNTGIPVARLRRNLELAAKLCPTWIQTCVFALDGKPPTVAAQESYLQFISALMENGIPLKGIMLYGIARPSYQPEASRLTRLPVAWLEQYASRLRSTGIEVKVSA